MYQNEKTTIRLDDDIARTVSCSLVQPV